MIVRRLLCALYERIESFWEARIQDHDYLMVWLVDLFGHPCKYCTAWRGMFIAFGLGLIVAGKVLLGLVPVGLVVGLVLIERLACNIKAYD